jgi:hypothetical protein
VIGEYFDLFESFPVILGRYREKILRNKNLVFTLSKIHLYNTYIWLFTDPYSGKACCLGLYCTLYWGKVYWRVKRDGPRFTGHKNCHGFF